MRYVYVYKKVLRMWAKGKSIGKRTSGWRISIEQKYVVYVTVTYC